MRLHLRLVALCTVAVLAAAGCANDSDRSAPIVPGVNNALSPAGECLVDIGDRVWFDVNCNGIQDKDETGGPEGVEVTLTNCDTQQQYTTYTDSDGNYLFTVPAGSYVTCVELPEGYAFAEDNEGDNDGIDSDVDEATGCTACREYECDKPDLTRDAGLCEKKGEEGGEGCTPGFWRNHLSHWAAAGISPDDLANDTFDCDLVPSDATTLGEVIDAPQTYGALAFHAVAALLNASHPDVDYDLGVSDVIEAACEGDKDTLSEANEAGCPLSGGNTTGGGPQGPAGGNNKRNR
jgi:hypothetical protein